MAMTKQDYKLIAEVLREARDHEGLYVTSPEFHAAVQWIENHLAAKLYRYNPRFDKAQFLEACQP